MDEIGGWVIERLLGEGGIASVYLARGRGGRVPVALKVIVAARCTKEARARFVHEVRAVQKIRHPNVAPSSGSGRPGMGLYLVMELLDGEDLDHGSCRRAPVEAVRVGCAAAAALAAAHASGIVHRDVKPANVFLCSDGGVKVVDFGLAVRVHEVARRGSQGQPPIIVGTPGYMAVEQARGQHDEDVRTDVWGLGATPVHALVGRPPFEAPDARWRSSSAWSPRSPTPAAPASPSGSRTP